MKSAGSNYTCTHGKDTHVFSNIEHRHTDDATLCPDGPWNVNYRQVLHDRRAAAAGAN